jgi:hypothetical protein
MTEATQKDPATQRATDLDFNTAHNLIFFRFNESTVQREMRLVKLEGCHHPLEWLPFTITNKGIQMEKAQLNPLLQQHSVEKTSRGKTRP